MGVLIRDMEMPKACWECPLKVHLFQQLWCTPSNKVINRNDNTKREPDCPLVEVPEEFGDLIDKEKLYERTAEWESQALNQVQKLMHRDDEEGKAEWRRWSAILNERTAFKHDVTDAPVVIEGDNQ